MTDPYFMQSLARGLSVIRAFGCGRSKLTGTEVAAITGLSRAAARRCLHTLRVLGYAETHDGVFELTPAVLALGQSYRNRGSIATVSQPVIERVAEQLQESTGVAVLDGDEVVFVARAASRRILSVEIAVGGRLPAACTASGRVLLAHADRGQRTRFLTRVKLTAYTPRTIVDKRALRLEIERVRDQGYAVVDQELELGLRSVAVPIHAVDGAVVGAVNMGVQAGRIETRTMVRDFVPVLTAAATEIGRTAS